MRNIADLRRKYLLRVVGAIFQGRIVGFNEQIFGADEQVPGQWAKRLRSEKATPYAFPGIK